MPTDIAHRGAAPARAALLVAASMLLALGLTLPLIEVERLWLFSDTPSLIGIVRDLWVGEERLLAAVVALVSIVFPVAKLWTAQVVAIDADTEPPAWLSALSRWSMMDVVLVALAIFAAKTSGLAGAATQSGLWCYAGSALAALAAVRLGRRTAAS